MSATPTPCGNPNWINDPNIDNHTDILGVSRDQTDCGMYFYDGEFNCIRFPVETIFYNGSSGSANSLSEFPAGFIFYRMYDVFDPNVFNPPNNFVDLVAQSNEELEEIISQHYPVTASWFSDLATAQAYSKKPPNPPYDPNIQKRHIACDSNCVLAYRAKKEINMILLNDNYNIAKFLQLAPTAPANPDVRASLNLMFGINPGSPSLNPVRTDKYEVFERVDIKNKERHSYTENDSIFVKWFCRTVNASGKYSGLCAPRISTQHHGGMFAKEYIFCNVFKWLKRDLSNPNDWQYNPSAIPIEISVYIEQLKKYESVNINFHSGNLYEHSVWSLLYAEFQVHNLLINSLQKLVEDEKTQVPDINLFNDIYKLSCVCSFLHDIGNIGFKSKNIKRNIKRGKFQYFSIPNHPDIGANYIGRLYNMKTMKKYDGIKIYNDMLEDTKMELDIQSMINLMLKGNASIPVSDEVLYIIRGVIKGHLRFGEVLEEINRFKVQNRYNSPYNEVEMNGFARLYLLDPLKGISRHLAKYNTKEVDFFYFKIFVYCSIVTSISDILATQPYGIGQLDRWLGGTPAAKNILNTTSNYFPYISNVSKKYKGVNFAEELKVLTNGIECAKFILTHIKEIYMMTNRFP